MNKKLTREQRVIKLLDKLQIYEKGYVVHKHTMLKSSYVAGLIMKELTANTEDEYQRGYIAGVKWAGEEAVRIMRQEASDE